MSLTSSLSKLLRSKRALKAANAARDAGDWYAAASHYERHVKSYPDDAPIWIQLGHAYKEQGILNKAEEAYSKALLLRPEDPDAHIMIGHLKKQAGNLRQAAAHYDDAVNLAPDSLDARIQIAFTEKDLGNIEIALNHYRVINEIDPSNDEVVGLIKQLSTQLRAKEQRGEKSGNGSGAGKHQIQQLESTVRAMAAEIHRLRDIIDEVETRFLASENSQLLAYQQIRQEVQSINKKLIDVEDHAPRVTGRFDELLAQLEQAKSKIAAKN